MQLKNRIIKKILIKNKFLLPLFKTRIKKNIRKSIMMQDSEAARLKKNLGERIKYFRKKQGLSQTQLAEIVNIEMKSLSRIESGHNYPQCENLVAIARALNVAPWQLYFDDSRKDLEAMKNEVIKALEDKDKIFPLYQYLAYLR